jgi:SOS-response transcriptional repressor LexA
MSAEVRVNRRLMRSRRALLDIDQTELARRAGVSTATISNLESGYRGTTKIRTLSRIAEALGVTLMELLEEGAPGATAHGFGRVRVPLAGVVPGGVPMAIEPQVVDQYVDLPVGWLRGARKVAAWLVSGQSMAPEIADGDMVVVDPEGSWVPGDVVVVRVSADLTLKRVVRRDGSIRLVGNGDFELDVRDEEVVVLGKVVNILKAFPPSRGQV